MTIVAESFANLPVVLSVLAVVVVVAWLGVARYAHCTLAQVPFYLANLTATRLLWRAQVIGRVPFGHGQGAVIVCNHRGPVDPAFIALAVHRPVHWMVAKEYCEGGLYGLLLRILEVIPVNRGGIDTASTKLAVRLAAEGGLVGMFPEGRLNTTDQVMLPGRPGAALVALRARVPIVPCYLQDSPNDQRPFGFLLQRCHTKLIVGEPIDLSPWYDQASDRGVQQQITLRFMKEIARLGGYPDFEPQLAGRNWKTDGEQVDAQ